MSASKSVLPSHVSSMEIAAAMDPQAYRRINPVRLAKLLAERVATAEADMRKAGRPVEQVIQDLLTHFDPMVQLGALRFALDAAKAEAAIQEAEESARFVISAQPEQDADQWLDANSPSRE